MITGVQDCQIVVCFRCVLPGPMDLSHVLYNLAKGPRVLNKKGKEGSILALWELGQGQILHNFQNLKLGFRAFPGFEIGKIRGNGGRGAQGEISYYAARNTHISCIVIVLKCTYELTDEFRFRV